MSQTTAITLHEAVELFPKRNGKAVTVATLKRRVKHGCRGVRLEAFMSGGVWFTTREAVAKFERECTTKVLGEYAPTTARKINQDDRDYLASLGIGNDQGEEKENHTRKRPAGKVHRS